MRRYIIAYVAWLAAVLAMAGVALAWYRHVEQVGMKELRRRLHETHSDRAEDETGFAPGGTV